MIRWKLPVCMIFFLLFSFFNHAFAQTKQSGTALPSVIDKAGKQRVLRVGIVLSKPSVMLDKTDEFIGFEIDIAAKLAEDLNARAQYTQTTDEDIIPGLLSKQYDIIICGLKKDEDLNKKVDFSEPYNYTGMSILGLLEYKVWFRKLQDFNNPNVKIVTLKETNAATDAVKKFLPKAKLKQYNDETAAIEALLNKKAHAMVASSTMADFAAIRHSDKLFIPLTNTLTKEPIAFAIRKNDPKTLTFLNDWIQKVEDNGWLQERKNFWFKSTDWEKLVK